MITMIEVYKDWVIDVDSRQYITGKRYRDKKGNVSMSNQRYFRTLSQAVADIAERVSKERLQDKDMSLKEAVEVLRITYEEFGAKVDELNMLLKKQDSYQAKGAE